MRKIAHAESFLSSILLTRNFERIYMVVYTLNPSTGKQIKTSLVCKVRVRLVRAT